MGLLAVNPPFPCRASETFGKKRTKAGSEIVVGLEVGRVGGVGSGAGIHPAFVDVAGDISTVDDGKIVRRKMTFDASEEIEEFAGGTIEFSDLTD